MGMPEPDRGYFTYDDYLTWPDDERWELIDGRPYAMTPAPSIRHQDISATLVQMLKNFFEGKPCRVYHAPVDVRLPKTNQADEAVDTVVQPDVLVVCDRAKLDEKGVRGAPDLIIEILSPSTSQRDMGDKLFLYEKHGVRGYIIVDPWGKTCTVRLLAADGRYGHPEIYTEHQSLPIPIFPDCTLDLARVFAE